MKRHLAQSEHFEVVSEYEYVDLVIKKHSLFQSAANVYLGDFYGDPTCALISKAEKYVVIGGNGLIIYQLRPPYAAYESDTNDGQYLELGREPENTWWVESLYQAPSDQDDNYFRATVTIGDETIFVLINAVTGEHVQLPTPNTSLLP